MYQPNQTSHNFFFPTRSILILVLYLCFVSFHQILIFSFSSSHIRNSLLSNFTFIFIPQLSVCLLNKTISFPYLLVHYLLNSVGTAVAQWLRCCATNQKVTGSIPACFSGFFIDIKSFRSHYGPGVDSAPNRNEYQEYFLGVKAAGA